MRYLVDTNVLVDVTRGSSAAADYLDLVLGGYRAIPPSEDIARRAYDLMKTYTRSHGLHPLDALIAATALKEGLTLASKNRKQFQMISGLDLEVPDY